MPVASGGRYALSIYLRAPHGPPSNATVSLLSGGAAGSAAAVLASATFEGLTPEWEHFTAELVSSGADTQARLAVSSACGPRPVHPRRCWTAGKRASRTRISPACMPPRAGDV